MPWPQQGSKQKLLNARQLERLLVEVRAKAKIFGREATGLRSQVENLHEKIS
jgi:hypothetical protein